MDIQLHARTARIKALAGKLYHGLTFVKYSLWLMWPFLILSLLPGGTIRILGLDSTMLDRDPMGMVIRVLLAIGMAIFLVCMQRFIHQLRELMGHFRRGAMFCSSAIVAARRALSAGAGVFVLNIAGTAITEVAKLAGPNPRIDIGFDQLILGLLAFGIMYVLLWTLEVGHDIHEESELTV